MTQGILMSEYIAAEISERIEELIDRGDVEAVESLDEPVLIECARRYLSQMVAQRKRAQSRNRERLEKVREEANARLRAKTRTIVDELARELHREWSASLLASTFALPNGSRVSWADASADQHEARAAQLESMAAGDLHTASIHRRAVSDILSARVKCLGEVK